MRATPTMTNNSQIDDLAPITRRVPEGDIPTRLSSTSIPVAVRSSLGSQCATVRRTKALVWRAPSP